MNIITFAAFFFLVWWVVFFAMLPLGVKSQHEAGEIEPGTDPGAPQRPLLLWKVAATTVVTAVLVVIVYALWEAGLIAIDRLPLPILSRTFGRRRGWLLATQAALALSLLALNQTGSRILHLGLEPEAIPCVVDG